MKINKLKAIEEAKLDYKAATGRDISPVDYNRGDMPKKERKLYERFKKVEEDKLKEESSYFVKRKKIY